MKNDHRSEFSNLSNWKEEAWKKKKKIRASTGFEPVTSALINLCRQLALDGVVDTDVDFKSDGAVSSPTYYLLFSLFSYLKTLSYKTPIMYFEWMWPSDFGVSVLVTTGAWQIRAESSRVFGYQIHLVQEGVKVWWTLILSGCAGWDHHDLYPCC